MFTNTEVVFFYLLLCSFDTFRDHWSLNSFTFLKAKTVHYARNTLRCEQTHKLIFERYIENRRTWVSLSTSTTTQLTVNTTAFVSFCTYNCKTTSIFYFLRKLDVGTTSRHVCCNSNGTFTVFTLSCFSHNECFLLVKFSIKNIMRNVSEFQHT